MIRPISVRTVYIAGPYTANGFSEEENVQNAITAADAVAQMGLIPFVPHLYHYWEKQYPHAYQFWVSLSMFWLHRCDMVLRLPGASKGADKEVEVAVRYGKPVFPTLNELYDFHRRTVGA